MYAETVLDGSVMFMKRIISILSLCALLVTFVAADDVESGAGQTPDSTAAVSGDKLSEQVTATSDLTPFQYDADIEGLPYFSDVLDVWEAQGVPDGTQTVPVDLLHMADETQAPLPVESDGCVRLEEQDYTFSFTCPQTGLYELQAVYRAPDDGGSTIARSLAIDGEHPYQEAMNTAFDRQYRVPDGPVQKASNGDDVRKKAEEIFPLTTVRLYDAGGLYSVPLRFYLEAGEHTLTLGFVSEALCLQALCFVTPERLPTYEQVQADYDSAGYTTVPGQIAWVQGEDAVLSNDTSVRAQSSPDPGADTPAYGDFILNVFGGDRWVTGNQWGEWTFTVPETGLYRLNIKCAQWYNDGRPSYRQIAIDGQIPFEELRAYEFPFDKKWQNQVLSDEEGEPFLFYLTAGEIHTLRMTVKVGDMSHIINLMSTASLELSGVIRDILAVTGYDIDPNYRYRLDEKIPTLMDDMRAIRQIAQDILRYVDENLAVRPSFYYTLESMVDTYDAMIERPDRITVGFSDLTTYQANFGEWINGLKSNGLMVDKIAALSPDVELPRADAGFFKGVYSNIVAFLKSFVKDYRATSDDAMVEGNETIDVWLSSGREAAGVLSDLINNRFTPEQGINVNLSVFPTGQVGGSSGVLYLAINSGTAPDAALQVDTATPTEYAFRNAVVDVSKLPGFEEFRGSFIDSAFDMFTYNGGIYGVPCTQDFQVMFYRKDILSALGLGIPNKWEDVYAILPILSEHGYEFYYPMNFSPFLLQNGGDMYTADHSAVALDTPEAFAAFKQFTELYTNYNLPKAANFLNRFRTGETPIGVGGFNEYIQFAVLAPELVGRWGIAPLPGIKKGDTIDRSNSVPPSSANIILADSNKVEEAWTFIRWWMQADTQAEYGREVEAIMGVGGRWNSANVEAFESLPWSPEDLEVIHETWRFNKIIPNVIGSYAQTRYMDFAINDVIVNGKDVRTSLEQAVRNINKEMKKKRAEFGYE